MYPIKLFGQSWHGEVKNGLAKWWNLYINYHMDGLRHFEGCPDDETELKRHVCS